MKALFKTKKGFGNVELIDIPEPKCKSNQVKIKVKNVGICGTDLHIYEGYFPYFNPPVILGHEFSGIIVEIGKEVKNSGNLNSGDKVVVLPSAAIICGKCEYCKSGNFIFCSQRKGMGHGVNGAMTEYVCVKEDIVYKLHKNISLESAVLIEPLSCSIQSVDDFVNISSADYCMVSGPGTIGLLITSLLKLRSCSVALVGLSNDAKRLEIGKDIGADLILNVENNNFKEKLMAQLNINEFDNAFECSGSTQSLINCINYLRKMGTLIQVGLFSKEQNIFFNNIVLKQLKVFGSLGFTWKSWDKSLKLLKDYKINSKLFITHRYRLKDWEKAFLKSSDRDALKVLIQMD